jgi:hypothetical protein
VAIDRWLLISRLLGALQAAATQLVIAAEPSAVLNPGDCLRCRVIVAGPAWAEGEVLEVVDVAADLEAEEAAVAEAAEGAEVVVEGVAGKSQEEAICFAYSSIEA